MTPMLSFSRNSGTLKMVRWPGWRANSLAIGEFVAFVGEKVTQMHWLSVEERTPRDPITVDRPFLQTDAVSDRDAR